MGKKKVTDYLKDFWRDIVNVEGRITGKDFFITYLLLMLVSIVLFVSVIGMILLPIFWLICLVGIFTMAIRRLNDIGKSRWFIILLFIPFLVNIIFLIYLCCKPSKIVTENERSKQYMKISNKILIKSLFITIIVAFVIGIIAMGIAMFITHNEYEKHIYYASEKHINEEYQDYLSRGYSYFFGSKENISYETFRSKYIDYFLDRAKYDLEYFKLFQILEIVIIILFVPVLISTIKYLRRTNKLIRHIKEYRDYMLATNSYKIEDIAKEFNAEPRLVEAYIQKAINKHILKNVYLSKQTKEVLLVNKYV